MTQRVRIGLIGTGFAARFHLASYRKVYGEDFQVVALCGRQPARVAALAEQFGIVGRFTSSDELLRDPGINVVDLCVPNHLHAALIQEAARHGKHVICEKPLGGYFGPPGATDAWSAQGAPRQAMLEAVADQARQVRDAVQRAGITFCYGENWVYAPPIAKVNRLMAASESAILRIEAEESHSGSHAAYARRWRTAGGGSLLRLGVHPIGGALHLKYEEGRRRTGQPIRPASVLAQVATLTEMATFRAQSPHHLITGWHDVEDWCGLLLTFADGSVAQLSASDTTLGGIRNYLSAYGSRCVATAHINPNNSCVAYTPSGQYLQGEYLVEKAETKEGWSFPAPDEDAVTGYVEELRDFIHAVATRREPQAGLMLAMDVLAVVYAGYLSAEQGRRVDLGPYLG